jgi:CRISPR system Cascade subunit CasD
MSSETVYLALVLDSPLQAWGTSSQFERRTTGLAPSKSGITGMICAAMGLQKGSETETAAIRTIAAAEMLSITVPKSRRMQRLIDYHTVQGTRRASNEPNKQAVETQREYLLDARFALILGLPREFACNTAEALQNPIWGIWLGRKSCIPAEPVCRGVFETEPEALRQLLGDAPLETFTTVRDSHDFENATDSVRDQPVSFGDVSSSGSHLRQYATRRITVISAEMASDNERPQSPPKNP